MKKSPRISVKDHNSGSVTILTDSTPRINHPAPYHKLLLDMFRADKEKLRLMPCTDCKKNTLFDYTHEDYKCRICGKSLIKCSYTPKA